MWHIYSLCTSTCDESKRTTLICILAYNDSNPCTCTSLSLHNPKYNRTGLASPILTNFVLLSFSVRTMHNQGYGICLATNINFFHQFPKITHNHVIYRPNFSSLLYRIPTAIVSLNGNCEHVCLESNVITKVWSRLICGQVACFKYQ